MNPPVTSGKKGLKPKLSGDLRVMSIGLFTGDNSVPMRGIKKHELISQLFSLTDWGRLDYLLVDLPPSTGDEVLSAFEIFGRKSSLVLVTTPSTNAVSVVLRLRRLAESEKIPLLGIVANMAYAMEGKRRIEVFGRFDREDLEHRLDARLLAEMPLYSEVNSKALVAILNSRNAISREFDKLANSLLKVQSNKPTA